MWSTKRLTDDARAICRNVCLFSAKVSNIASNAFTETSYRLVCTDKKKQTMGHLQLAVVSFWRHIFVIRPRVMRSMCHRLPRTHVNSDQRVCLRIATVLIFSAVKTHSYSGYCDNILNTEHSLDFNEMDWGCQLQNTMWRDTALRHDWQPIARTDARIFFLIIVIFVAMMMKEMYGAFDEMTKAMCWFRLEFQKGKRKLMHLMTSVAQNKVIY